MPPNHYFEDDLNITVRLFDRGNEFFDGTISIDGEVKSRRACILTRDDFKSEERKQVTHGT